MEAEARTPEVRHNPEEARFEIEVEGYLCVAEYALDADTITFSHTEVPPELGGRGLGSLLARAALAHAREQNLRVIPSCAFIAGYVKRHPDTHDLVPPEHRGLIGR